VDLDGDERESRNAMGRCLDGDRVRAQIDRRDVSLNHLGAEPLGLGAHLARMELERDSVNGLYHPFSRCELRPKVADLEQWA